MAVQRKKPPGAEPFELGGVSVAPGSSARVDLDVGSFVTHEKLRLQVHIIHGKQAGPVMLVMGCVHGDEFNGTEIIRRILRHKSLKRLKGTLLAIPIVNRPGFIRRSRYLPDRRDLNRLFPGSPHGPLGSRLAHVLTETVFKRVDLVVDLHTGAVNRSNLPQLRINPDDSEAMEFALAFGAPAILKSRLRDGSVRATCGAIGVPVVLYESGEALRLDGHSIHFGVKGVLNCMRKLGLLSGRGTKAPSTIFIAERSEWQRAPVGGIFTSLTTLGQAVTSGSVLGFIADPQGSTEIEVTAYRSGILIGRTNEAIVDEGDGLFHIALTKEGNAAADDILQHTDAADEEIDESDDHPI